MSNPLRKISVDDDDKTFIRRHYIYTPVWPYYAMLCYNIILLLLQFSLSVRIFFLNYILYEIEKNDNNNNNNLLNQENKGHRSGIV